MNLQRIERQGNVKCHCKDKPALKIKKSPLFDTKNGLILTTVQLEKMKDDISLGAPVDISKIKEEVDRKKSESRKRVQEFKELDEKFGHASKKNTHLRSLTEDIESAKADFYRERAKVISLRECEDFKDMNSFVYKAKCQAIRDNQIRQKEVMKQDAEILLKKEIEDRYKNIEDAFAREMKERAEQAKVNEMHLKSLIFMIDEKKIEDELRRLRYQQAAMIRNNHTAYRLKKRLEQLAGKDENNKQIRALQRGVYENRQQMEAIQNQEKQILDEREKAFFERKNNYLKEFNAEKDAIKKIKNDNMKQIFEAAERRNQDKEYQSDLAYIRDKDLADKKWRMEMEEKEKKRQLHKQQLWEEQEKTKEDILDHICLATERDRLDFERIVRENKEDYLNEQQIEMDKKKKTEEVRRDLQCTINEKIEKRREEEQRTMENANNQVLDDRLYVQYHDREMYRELTRLRNEGLEEKYISETIRHCNITPDQTLKKSLI